MNGCVRFYMVEQWDCLSYFCCTLSTYITGRGGSIKKQFQKEFDRDLLSKLSHKHVFRKTTIDHCENKAKKKEKGLAGRGIIAVMLVRPHCI